MPTTGNSVAYIYTARVTLAFGRHLCIAVMVVVLTANIQVWVAVDISQ
jgi:hypothetical protein